MEINAYHILSPFFLPSLRFLKSEVEIMSNFTYISYEYPQLANIGQLAERNVFVDPSTSLSKLRLLVEKLTVFIIEFSVEKLKTESFIS
ncbi:MAG: hypothetical protein HRT73_08235 [Flavobacteriales bacterium]|nr:hypothetical protein [Flavobacteriales bacterium]